MTNFNNSLLSKASSNCGSISLEVHQDFPNNQEAWDELVEATNAGIYLTYDWCQAWWEYYGLNRSLRIYLLYDASQQLVGVMPMFIDAISIGLQRIRLAKTVGSDFTIATCEIPVLKEWMDQALKGVISELTCNEHCDAILLGPMVSGENQTLVHHQISQMSDMVKQITYHSRRPQTIFHCPATLEDYIKPLGKNAKTNFRKKWRRLCNAYDITEDVVMDFFGNENAFREFMDMHTEQWVEQGNLGHFGDWPFAKEFHIDVARRQAGRGRFFLLRILDGDRVISYQYAYGCGNTLHWLLVARSIDPELVRLSLGDVSQGRAINWAIGQGYKHMDAGPGHYPYKLQLGASEHERQSVLIVRNNLASRWRCFVFRIQGNLLDLFYYKIWCSRVAPRLHVRQPLWKSWIRRQLS